MLSTTHCARDGRVRLTHRADGLEDFLTILADIFVNRHNHLVVTTSRSTLRVSRFTVTTEVVTTLILYFTIFLLLHNLENRTRISMDESDKNGLLAFFYP